MLNISAEYFCQIFQITYYQYYVKNERKYLKGLTVVNRNRSANPLCIHIVFPIAIKALKKGWGCTPRHIDVELIGTYLCHNWAKDILSPWPSKSWFIRPILLSFQLSCPLISWKNAEASSVTTIPYPHVDTNLSSIPI